jgi:hypothetical protein
MELSFTYYFIPIMNIGFHLSNDRPPQPHLGWGRYHSSIFETNGLSFHNQFWIFKSSQIIFIMFKMFIPSMGVIRCDLDILLN